MEAVVNWYVVIVCDECFVIRTQFEFEGSADAWFASVDIYFCRAKVEDILINAVSSNAVVETKDGAILSYVDVFVAPSGEC
jgi:hypothetical protein